jgi:putative ABC transport system permease protein
MHAPGQMGDILLDLRFAFRRLAAEPLLTLVAAATLALGVSATVVMGDILDRLLLRPPPHVSDPDRVVRFYARSTVEGAFVPYVTTWDTFAEYARQPHEDAEALAVYRSADLSLGVGPDARQVAVVSHSREYFDVLGMRPALGVLPLRDTPDYERMAVLSHHLWRSQFGASPDVLGTTIHLDTEDYTVVAVTPPGFAGIDTTATDLWLSLDARGDHGLYTGWRKTAPLPNVIGRLRHGVPRESAAERASAMLASDAQGDAPVLALGHLLPPRGPTASRDVRVSMLDGALSGFVLLIACGNVASLMLLRAWRRSHETLVKLALGATRARLTREVLADAGILGALAGLGSLVIVVTGGEALRTLLLPPVAATASPLDGRVIALAAGVSAMATFLLAAAAATRLATAHARLPDDRMRATPPARTLDVFVGLQIALTVPLVVGAGLFATTIWQARQHDYGLRTDNIVVVEIKLGQLGRTLNYHDVHRRLQEHLGAAPHVTATSLSRVLPLSLGPRFLVTRDGLPDDAMPPRASVNAVDPAYLDMVGLRVVRGRPLSSDDNHPGARPVGLVNESLARQLWPVNEPVGECFQIVGPDLPCIEIVGVVADVQADPSLLTATALQRPPAVLVPVDALPTLHLGGTRLLLRTDRHPGTILPALRTEAQRAVPDLPYVNVWALDDVYEPMLKPWRLAALVCAAFGAVALLIASVGLAVVTSHVVTRRRRELGIRAAMGAQPAQLVSLVMRRSGLAVLGGLLLGLALSHVGGRAVDALLYGVSSDDLWLLAVVAAVLFAVAAVATWLPARRAGHIDPASALREL